MAKSFGVVVFHCRHMFHKECLPSSGTVSGSTFLKSFASLQIAYALICRTNLSFLFSFLECSFVISAVQRDVGQEVEYLRWRSNKNVCAHNIVVAYWCFYAPPPPCCFTFTVHWSIIITFPQSLKCAQNAKYLYWTVCVFISNNCKVL